MNISKETLQLCLNLLGQVRVNPLDQDSDVTWIILSNARGELTEALREYEVDELPLGEICKRYALLSKEVAELEKEALEFFSEAANHPELAEDAKSHLERIKKCKDDMERLRELCPEIDEPL